MGIKEVLQHGILKPGMKSLSMCEGAPTPIDLDAVTLGRYVLVGAGVGDAPRDFCKQYV